MAEEIRKDKKPLTDETRKNLLKTTSDLIQYSTIELDEISKSVKMAATIENNVAQAINIAQTINSSFGDIISYDENTFQFFNFQ